MGRDVAGLIIRLQHRLEQISPGLVYPEFEQHDHNADDDLVYLVKDIVRADPNASKLEVEAFEFLDGEQ